MSMGNITSINQKRATVEFPDFCIRVFAKYRGPYCTELRVWKLPPGGSFWHMFNTKNLAWAVYDDQAKTVHGWFSREPKGWLQAFVNGIAHCQDYDDVKGFLINIEGVINGDSGAMAEFAVMEEENRTK